MPDEPESFTQEELTLTRENSPPLTKSIIVEFANKMDALIYEVCQMTEELKIQLSGIDPATLEAGPGITVKKRNDPA